LPPGPEPKKQEGSGAEPYDENNPKPDWETYDPKKAAPAINGPKTETAPSELPLPDATKPVKKPK
jgi:hypothetical protein